LRSWTGLKRAPLSLLRRMSAGGKGLPAPLIERLIRIVAARDLAWATARLARLTMQNIYVPDCPRAEGKTGFCRRVLLLPKVGLVEDALSALSSAGSVEVLTLPRKTIKAIAGAFLPREVNDNNYLSASPSAKAAMIQYRAFLARFWRALDPHRRIDAVISGNFAYYAEREFAAALEALGVPFIVLHKENSWSPGTQAFWGKIYRERRGPFLGRRILVYSPIERDLQLGAEIVDPQRIEVVGMPRLDEVHRWRAANVGLVPKPTLLFASFPPDVAMPVVQRDTVRGGPKGSRQGTEMIAETTHSFDVANLCRKTHRAIVELAAACPEITVVVKTKGRQRDRMELLELLGVRDEHELPSNLRLIHGGSPLPLIFQASVVCGFHSTLLLEALAAGRPVVVPWFDEALDATIRQYVFDLSAAVIRASSPADLIERVRTLALAPMPVPQQLSSETAKILRDWVGNEDGLASERAGAAILRIIDANRLGT
jgi:glycosyltransferase involved in cell wall biosynthesis